MTPAEHHHRTSSAHPEPATIADLDESLLDASTADQVSRHLAGCATCQARRIGLAEVRHELRAAGGPMTVPDDVARGLDAALAAAAAAATAAPVTAPPTPSITPLARRPRTPWNSRILQAAAVVVLLLALGGLAYSAVLTSGGGQAGGDAAASGAGAESAGKTAPDAAARDAYPVTQSGRDYTKESLRAAVPSLLLGVRSSVPSPQAATDATAGSSRVLRGVPLATCVANLAGGPVTPLAVDGARYEGKPATVIVLPTEGDAGTVDAYVVAPGCPAGTFVAFERVARR